MQGDRGRALEALVALRRALTAVAFTKADVVLGDVTFDTLTGGSPLRIAIGRVADRGLAFEGHGTGASPQREPGLRAGSLIAATAGSAMGSGRAAAATGRA